MALAASNSKAAPGLLQQLETVMASKDKENEALRRQVQILESILRQHGINKVVAVNMKETPSAESVTSDSETESESVSSITNADEDRRSWKKVAERGDTTKVVRKVTTICEDEDEEDEDDDDEATVRTTTTVTTAATGHTRRSLIMPPPNERPIEPEPRPVGTSDGGRWYKLIRDQSLDAKSWTQRLSCTCSPDDVDSKVVIYLYYDRNGNRGYHLPNGDLVKDPLSKAGSKLVVVPNDGTLLTYFRQRGLPLYHQKQRSTKKRFLLSSRPGPSRSVRIGPTMYEL